MDIYFLLNYNLEFVCLHLFHSLIIQVDLIGTTIPPFVKQSFYRVNNEFSNSWAMPNKYLFWGRDKVSYLIASLKFVRVKILGRNATIWRIGLRTK